MDTNDRLTKLKQQRKSLKYQTSSLKNFINKNKNNINEIQLKLRHDRLKSLFDSFNEVQNELETLDPEGGHEEQREEIDNNFFAVSADVHKLLNLDIISVSSTPTPRTATPSLSEVSINSELTQKRRLKLPEIKIPSFSGKYEEWVSFKDTFSAIINSDKEISEIEN